MYTIWTKDLTSEDQKKEWNYKVSSASPVLLKILKVLKSELDNIEDKINSKDQYTNASWPYYISDLLGQKRVILRINDLINNLYEGRNS